MWRSDDDRSSPASQPGHRADHRFLQDARGQTVLDFAIGASVFLIALGFLFMTLPGIVAPFSTPGAQGDALRAERATAQLTNQLLTDNRHVGQPTSLDKQCTQAFFDGSESAATCPFEQSDSVQERLGLRTIDTVNITVRDTGGSIATMDGSRLTAGESLPQQGQTTATTRIVYIDGEAYRLTVTIW